MRARTQQNRSPATVTPPPSRYRAPRTPQPGATAVAQIPASSAATGLRQIPVRRTTVRTAPGAARSPRRSRTVLAPQVPAPVTTFLTRIPAMTRIPAATTLTPIPVPPATASTTPAPQGRPPPDPRPQPGAAGVLAGGPCCPCANGRSEPFDEPDISGPACHPARGPARVPPRHAPVHRRAAGGLAGVPPGRPAFADRLRAGPRRHPGTG